MIFQASLWWSNSKEAGDKFSATTSDLSPTFFYKKDDPLKKK